MTEFQCAIVVLVTVSVSAYRAVHQLLVEYAPQSPEFFQLVQQRVFRELMRGFLVLAVMIVAASTLGGMAKGIEMVAAGLFFGLFIAVPNLVLGAVLAFLTSHLLKRALVVAPVHARVVALLFTPIVFGALAGALIWLWFGPF